MVKAYIWNGCTEQQSSRKEVYHEHFTSTCEESVFNEAIGYRKMVKQHLLTWVEWLAAQFGLNRGKHSEQYSRFTAAGRLTGGGGGDVSQDILSIILHVFLKATP
ncbi:hypothetical protein TEQG_04350 [Trichophyton equinum CBS 127.97]|uniref:Uncharacterized protein n=1 Tax=Trichophyton equinum (strain ATCC MYA-4606 / CBS 127.97) TaxID=559882 RepID=F2PTH4_TRIEC|nr:hypothetical protein TEQG_04350 [Trichophyton equinum CBS 127.97]